MPDLIKKIFLSVLQSYTVKITIFFVYYFPPIQIFFRLNKKETFSNFYFYFFPSSDLNILEKKNL